MRSVKISLVVVALLANGCSIPVAVGDGDAAASPSGADATVPAGEETLQACRDGEDNDGDGHTDCEDQDCWIFAICERRDGGTSNGDASPQSLDSGPGADASSAGADSGTANALASLDYLGVVPTPVPLGGSAVVRFTARDGQGAPVTDLAVTFEVAPSGLASVEPSARTADDGTVATTLTAGNVAGAVVVTARGEGANGQVSRASDVIAISGSALDARSLTVVCPHRSIGGFQQAGLQMECSVYAADSLGGFVPSHVLLMTEAGGVPVSMGFVPDPVHGGVARFTYRAQCPHPHDVPPLGPAGDPGVPCLFWNECRSAPGFEARTCNPRDGWATLVAVVTGGESFTDFNGNGQRDDGESWVDLPEPFVDANDNGIRDPDEDYYDANNNQQWDDENGFWDPATSIWTAVRITWTGEPERLSLMPGNNGVYPHCGAVQYSGVLEDANGNPPTAAGSSDTVQATCTGNCKVTGVRSYDDADGVVEVDIADAHDCPDPCLAPDCSPASFKVDFSMTRTLAAGSSVEVFEDLNPVVHGNTGGDPGPRTGVFE